MTPEPEEPLTIYRHVNPISGEETYLASADDARRVANGNVGPDDGIIPGSPLAHLLVDDAEQRLEECRALDRVPETPLDYAGATLPGSESSVPSIAP
jgi:hypothetical protein